MQNAFVHVAWKIYSTAVMLNSALQLVSQPRRKKGKQGTNYICFQMHFFLIVEII